MALDPGSGGNQPGQNPFMRFLISSATALAMSGLIIGLYSTVPHYEPRFQPNGPHNPKVQNGFWEQHDLFGLVDTQWHMANGLAQGEALQYYSNGSLFRELAYRDGKLEGLILEYHEKGPYRKPPVRGRLAARNERSQSAGVLRKKMEYRNGLPEGSYQIYYADGILKEEGIYRHGVKEIVALYRKDGQPKEGRLKESRSINSF